MHTPSSQDRSPEAFAQAVRRVMEIMEKLRAPGGCPWDREQDFKTLRPYLIEECYEVLEALDAFSRGGSHLPLCEELGDLLFQIVFHAQLGRERGLFDLVDVMTAISDKIESRHPHVFGELKVEGTAAVLRNWAELKAQERQRKTGSRGSALDGVPRDAPALLRAERIGEKAARVGFDWEQISGVREKVDEEWRELQAALDAQDSAAIEHELGDLLFALTNLARWTKTPAEDALRAAIDRFAGRFRFVEQRLASHGRKMLESSPAELDALWNEAKRAL